jgi:hypothetical protein
MEGAENRSTAASLGILLGFIPFKKGGMCSLFWNIEYAYTRLKV